MILFHLIQLILHLGLSELLQTMLILGRLLENLMELVFVVWDHGRASIQLGRRAVRVSRR